jgi:hypothetical protein
MSSARNWSKTWIGLVGINDLVGLRPSIGAADRYPRTELNDVASCRLRKLGSRLPCIPVAKIERDARNGVGTRSDPAPKPFPAPQPNAVSGLLFQDSCGCQVVRDLLASGVATGASLPLVHRLGVGAVNGIAIFHHVSGVQPRQRLRPCLLTLVSNIYDCER